MIAITLLPFETQYVRAKEHKEKLKIVKTSDDFNPMLEAFRNNNYEYLFDTLKDIVTFTKNKSEEYYFIIPDTEFETINTEPYNLKFDNDENDLSFLEENDVDSNKFYYCFPTQMKTNDKWLKTYYTISKQNIDTLLKVAEDLDIVVKTIEPLSIALFRYMNNWQNETYIIEINKDKSDLVFYSPIFGFYKYQLSLNMNNFNNDTNLVENINEDLKYADNYFSKKLDNYLNANQDIILIMSERNKRSLNYKAPQYKKYITDLYNNNDDIIINNNPYFAIGVGSLLQSFQETYFNSKVSDCLLIKNSNILPQNFVSDNDLLIYKYNLQRKTKFVSLILAGVLALQIGAIFHFNSITIPEKLQNDYAIASKEIKILEQQEKTIKEALNVSEKPLDVLFNLIREKPDNAHLGFTELEISSSEGKTKVPNWIKLGLISNDSLTIKSYVTKLTENNEFGIVNVTSIDNNNQGAKVAEISILKPGQDLQDTKDKNAKNDTK